TETPYARAMRQSVCPLFTTWKMPSGTSEGAAFDTGTLVSTGAGDVWVFAGGGADAAGGRATPAQPATAAAATAIHVRMAAPRSRGRDARNRIAANYKSQPRRATTRRSAYGREPGSSPIIRPRKLQFTRGSHARPDDLPASFPRGHRARGRPPSRSQ